MSDTVTAEVPNPSPLVLEAPILLTPWYHGLKVQDFGDGNNIDVTMAIPYLVAEAIQKKLTLYEVADEGDSKLSLEEIYGFMKSLGAVQLWSDLVPAYRSLWMWDDGIGYVTVSEVEGGHKITMRVLCFRKQIVDECRKFQNNNLSKRVTAGKIYVMISTSGGLSLKSMGVAKSPLIPENYDPRVVQDFQHIIKDLDETGPCGRISILDGPPGCHRKGQGILMYDGSIKKVEDIMVGERLMGPDSSPRNVLGLCRNKGKMVEIIPTKGNSFVVNEDHILSLVMSGKDSSNELFDISVKDYLKLSKRKQERSKLVRSGVEFKQNTQFTIDPYFLGVILGDGRLTNTVGVSSMDKEIIDEIYSQAITWGLKVSRSKKTEHKRCVTYFPVLPDGHNTRVDKNPLAQALKKLGLKTLVMAPSEYKTASKSNRLAILAGLLDTDGSLSNKGFDYISKSVTLANDVAFIARSLGLAAYVKECKKSDQNGTVGTYHRVSISGDTDMIPCRLPRKKASSRKQIKNVLRTGFKIKELQKEDYFGFNLDGDNRYLMDDFTITHNSGKSFAIRALLDACPNGVFIMVPSNTVHMLGGPDVVNLLINLKEENRHSAQPIILVLEDADSALGARDDGNMPLVSTLLNFGDGLFGQMLDTRIIATTNADITELDEAITRPGRLCRRIHFGALDALQANQVYQRLTNDPEAFPFEKPTTLAEVYREARKEEKAVSTKVKKKSSIGFGG